MKKLKLNVAELGATEILTREELKKVLGGAGSGSGSGSGNECTSLSKDACSNSVSCKDSQGITGHCGWSNGDLNRCTCATVAFD